MPKNSTSFQPGKSGNPSGRPKKVRTLARLIDRIGSEPSAGTVDDFRTVAMRRLWEAAATGTLKMGEKPQQLKPNEWIGLVQWLVSHMDRVAIDQWAWQGSSQMSQEAEMEAAEYDVEAVEGDEGDAMEVVEAGNYEDEVVVEMPQPVQLLTEVIFSGN